MSKVLPGTSRAVFSFIGRHWADLVQVSLAPLAVLLAAAAAQMIVLRQLFAGILAIQSNRLDDPTAFDGLMRPYGFMMLAGLVTMVVFVWLYVRIVRLYALGENFWLGFGAPAIKATAMTAIYGIGIYALTMLAYLAVVLAAVLVGVVAAGLGMMLISGTEQAGLMVAMVMIPGLFAILAFMVWFFCRFAVGLPGVALGRSPDFFGGEMWRLSAGESWGLPLRLMLSYVVLLLVLTPIFVVLMWPHMAAAIAAIKDSPDGHPLPAVVVSILDGMLPAQVAAMAVQLPWLWFGALLCAETYRRLMTKPKG